MPSPFKSLSPYTAQIDQGVLGDTSSGTYEPGGLGSFDVASGASGGSAGFSGSVDGLTGSTGDLGSMGGGSGAFSLGAGLAAPAPTLVTTSGSALKINIVWETSVASAPSAFTTAVVAAAQYMESQFNNAVTINIDVGYGQIAGGAMAAGALGESESYLQSVSYASLIAALQSHNSDATTASVLASLPATAPVSGTIWLTTAQAKALGLGAANSTALDGYVGFSATNGFTYTTSGGIAAGTYDFNAVAMHEVSEVMGRMLLTGGSIGSTRSSYSLLDLMHYSAAGVRDFSATTPGYFSVNGGVTNGGTFNTVSGGDAGDWASSMGANAFDAYSSSGVVNAVTSGDITELNAIGWTLGSATPTPTPAPTPTPTPTPPPVPAPIVPAPGGVVIADAGSVAGALQGTSGLTANVALAKLTAAGGVAGDPLTYTLGGAGAGSFALTTASNAATLSAGAAGVAGAANGKVYALTVTVKDTKTNLSSAAAPIDVVVGSSGNDTVSVASLVGSASTAVPMFIYGLGGSDKINAAGTSGKLWIDGGAGADTMTGGSGVNTYVYGATSDSTASAMDIITNFATNKDHIDLTGIGSAALTFTGYDLGTQLAAHSIGYQFSGLNTFLYVNTSGASEALGATNMKIELNGWIPLSAANVTHS